MAEGLSGNRWDLAFEGCVPVFDAAISTADIAFRFANRNFFFVGLVNIDVDTVIQLELLIVRIMWSVGGIGIPF